jgi:hypothetical protein
MLVMVPPPTNTADRRGSSAPPVCHPAVSRGHAQRRGTLTGARVLAEIGDDRSRFADARDIKAYAGSAPVTRASGKSLIVMHRRVKTNAWPTPGTCGPSLP